MSYTSVAFGHDFATHRSRRPVRKTSPYNFLGAVAVVGLMLACAWMIYSNVLGASVYPALSGADFDLHVVKPPLTVATRNPQTVVNEVFARFARCAAGRRGAASVRLCQLRSSRGSCKAAAFVRPALCGLGAERSRTESGRAASYRGRNCKTNGRDGQAGKVDKAEGSSQ